MKIYNPFDVLIHDLQVDDNSVRYRSIMTDDSLTLHFSLVDSIEIPQFSYTIFEGERYTLWRPSEFKKHSSRNHEYTLTLHGWREYLKFVKFRDMGERPHRLRFPLTAKPIAFLQNLVNCLNQHDPVGGWSVGDCIDTPERTISFNHEFCLDVLNRLAAEFETEFEFEDKKIHLRRVERFKDNPLALSYGKGNGFRPGVGRYNEGDKQPVGRLFVQGGERNIDFSVYGSRWLLLPKAQTLVIDGKTFRTDAHGMCVTRDGNDNRAEDSLDASQIYPKRVGTVSDVIVVNAEKHFFDIVDNTIPEELNFRNYRIAGEKAIIRFESGALAGREFDIEQTADVLTGYIHAERRFRIVPAELDGFVMPGGIFVPRVGDRYAIFNIAMPQAYISDDATQTGASWDMFREAARYFHENENERFRFTGELDGVWSKSRWLQIGGQIVPGGHVLFSDEQFQQDGVVIRIVGIKDYVNKPHKPEITLSNAPISSGFSVDMGRLEANEVVIEEMRREVLRFSQRQWRDAAETMSMLQNSLLNFSGSVNPITVQTMQMIAGDESLQFRFVTNKTNPQPVNHTVAFNPTNGRLTADAGIIQHLTLGITEIRANRSPNDYVFWTMDGYTSPPLDPNKPYYLYARCSRTAATGTFLLSETFIRMEDEAGWLHLLMGILNSENGGDRSFAQLYGFSEILPGRITTDRIVSNDGRTFFDLALGIIGGRIVFQSGGSQTDLESWAGSTNNSVRAAQEAADGANNKIDNLQIGGVNLLSNSNDRNFSPFGGSIVTNHGKVAVPEWGATDANRVTTSGGTEIVKAIISLFTNTSERDLAWSCWVKNNGSEPIIIRANLNASTDSQTTLQAGEERRVVFATRATVNARIQFQAQSMSVGGNTDFTWWRMQVEEGNIATAWSESPLDTQQRIDQAQNTANAANTAVTNAQTSISSLRNFTDTTFRDGVVGRAERTKIEGYLNGIAETKLSIDAGFAQINLSPHLTGVPRTNLAAAHTALNTAHANLVNSINSAIVNDTVTPTQVADVNNRFGLFNTALVAYEVRLGEANRAIQNRLDQIARERVDNLQIGGVNLIVGTSNIERGGTIYNVDVSHIPDNEELTFSAYLRIVSGTVGTSAVIVRDMTNDPTGQVLRFDQRVIGVQRFVQTFRKPAGCLSIRVQFFTGGNTPNVVARHHSPQLERGNIATAWSESPLDTQQRIDQAQADATQARAITDGFTQIDGGLVRTHIISLRDTVSSTETAGINGLQGANRNNPAFWAGGTFAQALALIDYLNAPTAARYANLAKIAMMHNGLAKVGNFLINDGGRVSVVDPATGNERIAFDTNPVPVASGLMDKTMGSGNANIGEITATHQTVTLSGSLVVARDGATITVEPRAGQRVIQISAYTKSHSGNAWWGRVTLELMRGGIPFRALGETWVGGSAATGGNARTRDVAEIPVTTFNGCPAGTYTLRLRIDTIGEVGLLAAASASILSWRFVQAGFRRFEFGLDGMLAFFANNHMSFTENDGLDVRGSTNMPGVLASGSVDTNGSINPALTWGDKASSVASVMPNPAGTYVVPHRVGHSRYQVQITPRTAGRTFHISNKGNTSFTVVMSGGNAAFDYTIIGTNYP